MSDDSEKIDELVDEVQALRKEVAGLKKQSRVAGRAVGVGVRKRSPTMLFGMPLYDIALGPDPNKGELRGHAKGFFAIGDIATGIFALGGLSRGFFALGGLAFGVFSFGGLAIGVLLAMGGAAIGSLAFGGAAVGLIACGGAAIGLYAFGGAALSHLAWADLVAIFPFLGK
jgi:hypothetical protein